MDPITIAALAGLAGSALSAGTSKSASDKNLRAVRETNQANLDIMRETNQANAAINQQSLDAQMAMQKDAQRFNSPTTQSQLLRAAGLNPALNDSMAASVSAGSVPASIPAQGTTLQPPLVNYSDTYIDQGIAAIASAANVFKESNEGFGDFVDNQYKHEINIKELSKREAEINKILADTKVSRVERKRLLGELDSINLTNDIQKAARNDIVESYALQNQLSKQNVALAIEKVNETKENILVSQLSRQLSLSANSRAEKELRASVAKMYAEAYAAHQNGRLTEKEVSNYANKIARELLDNKLLSQQFMQNNITYPLLRKQLEQELRQSVQDYTNPFRYIMNFGSGSGAAALKMIK